MALNYLYELFQLIFGCRHDEILIEKILKREREPQYLVLSGCKRCGVVTNYLLMNINDINDLVKKSVLNNFNIQLQDFDFSEKPFNKC